MLFEQYLHIDQKYKEEEVVYFGKINKDIIRIDECI